MEQVRLEVELREGTGKGHARAIRRSGYIPGIVYGHKQEPVNIKIRPRDLRTILHAGGENVLVNMDIKGVGSETVMLKDTQIDPLTRQVLHVDFMRVSLEEKVVTHVPVALVGTAQGVKEGGILEFLLRELRVECRVGEIPEHIEVDISSLGIGDQIRVADIKLANGMSIHDDPATVVVTIAAPVVKEVTEEAQVEEEVEPELIERKREKREEEED